MAHSYNTQTRALRGIHAKCLLVLAVDNWTKKNERFAGFMRSAFWFLPCIN